MQALALVASACSGDDDPGWGTGGDDQMPHDTNPGPNGPSCGNRMGRPPGGGPYDIEAVPHASVIARVVAMRSEDGDLEGDPRSAKAVDDVPGSFTEPPRPLGATTTGSHIHERWGESRKLELSYCINGMPGEDAENEESYHKMVRALHATMAEWERVTGSNFVHIPADDTPDQPAHVTILGDQKIARADCAPGTKAYIGAIATQVYENGFTNAAPQAWNDASLDPIAGNLARVLLVDSDIVASFGDAVLLETLRHELGHVMGFDHEEASVEGQACEDPDARPLTPTDHHSILTTPGCDGVLSDTAENLTHHDRLSGFFLQHTPRSRFELRGVGRGYRYSGVLGGGAEILWHTEGATEGVLWRPQVGPDGIAFVEDALAYSWPVPPPAGGWFPNQSEVVIPLQLTAGPSTFDLLFYGPGPHSDEVAVFNSGISATAFPWSMDAFAVPVVGRFDGGDLGRDVVYLYQPGSSSSTALVGTSGTVAVLTDVPQQRGYAYPLAAPYRGSSYPDDIVWLEPKEGRVTTWRLGRTGVLELVEASRTHQDELGLAHGENIPSVGDFNGDGRADIFWHGVSNLQEGLPNIDDVLWLSESTPEQLAFGVVTGKEVGHTFRPIVGDFDGDAIDDIFWHRSWGMTSEGASVWSTGPSFVWYFDASGGHQSEAFVVDGDFSPYVGDFDADGCHDVAWFDAVGDTIRVWRCLPGARDFDCGTEMQAPPDSAPVGMHWGF